MLQNLYVGNNQLTSLPESLCASVTSLGPESSADTQGHWKRLRGSRAPLDFRVKYELENGSNESAPGSEAFNHDRTEPGS